MQQRVGATDVRRGRGETEDLRIFARLCRQLDAEPRWLRRRLPQVRRRHVHVELVDARRRPTVSEQMVIWRIVVDERADVDRAAELPDRRRRRRGRCLLRRQL